jgi:hypothetical protein
LAGFHLDKDATVYEKVSFIIPNIDAIVENLDALLLNHIDLGFPQLMGKCILVDLLQKTRAQFVGHPEAAADDEFGEWTLDGHGILPRSYLPAHPEKV